MVLRKVLGFLNQVFKFTAGFIWKIRSEPGGDVLLSFVEFLYGF